jgi:hypothetical protein
MPADHSTHERKRSVKHTGSLLAELLVCRQRYQPHPPVLSALVRHSATYTKGMQLLASSTAAVPATVGGLTKHVSRVHGQLLLLLSLLLMAPGCCIAVPRPWSTRLTPAAVRGRPVPEQLPQVRPTCHSLGGTFSEFLQLHPVTYTTRT